MWDDRKRKILDVVKARLTEKAWSSHDFLQPLDGLGDDLVDALSYAEAAAAGVEAMPGSGVDIDEVAQTWIGHVRKYADKVGPRFAGDIADAMHELAPDETTSDIDAILAAFDDKLESLRSSVTRYADPPWGTGWNGYGDSLREKNVLMVWVLDDGAAHCNDCPTLADGSPYEQLPTWPGMGDTQCLDRCKCTVQADQASWDAALGGTE